MSLLHAVFRRLIKKGVVTLIEADGSRHEFGAPDPALPELVVRFHDKRVAFDIVRGPRLGFAEGFMDGRISFEQGDIMQFVGLIRANNPWEKGLDIERKGPVRRAFKRTTRRWNQINFRRQSKRNVAHHYDLSGKLYDLFLDRDRQYSCAYFTDPANSLEQAQEDKKAHIAAKLALSPGQKVLDIGCGWGGMALYLHRHFGVEVTGITLSEEQLEVARKRAVEAGVSDHVRFELRDYRDLTGSFDRIVSVGMFEHVGVPNYDTFFQKVAELLTDDGVAVIHSIGRKDGPDITNPWIEKYIFPGGYIPALSEVLPAIERAGLWVTDIEILRLHYAETLVEWQRRFRAHRPQIAKLYDERFCRMWDFYLAASESAFRHQGHMNFQIQLARRVDAVPLTRDYITDRDRANARLMADAA